MISFVDKYSRILTISSIVLILSVSVLFGSKKHGFYIDEYYLYTVSNGTQFGIAIDQGKWNDTTDYTRQLVSEEDENFRFEQVYNTESNGVHPPLYYYMLHFMSSIFTGKFSKWIGILLNILILIPMLILVHKMVLILSGGNQTVSLLTLLLFGLSPATLSMVVLVRMYLLLGLWAILYAYLHVRDLERNKLSIKSFLLPVFITGFLGFLTQYFFVVIMFFITFIYAFYLAVFCRRIKDAIIYGLTALASLICTYPVWPFSYFHIFKGYRGKGAVSQLKDYSHIVNRIVTSVKWLDKLVFAHTFIIFFCFFVVGLFITINLLINRKRSGDKHIIRSLSPQTKGLILLSFASLLNFFALSQISLFTGIECSRQFYTSYALFLVLLPTGLYSLITYLTHGSAYKALLATVGILVLTLVLGHIQKNVLFLYEDEAVVLDYARQHPDALVVMFENNDGDYDSRIQELMLYQQVYYVPLDDISLASDPIIASADELLVYISTDADPEVCFSSIFEQNPNITKADLLCNCQMFFDVYLLK